MVFALLFAIGVLGAAMFWFLPVEIVRGSGKYAPVWLKRASAVVWLSIWVAAAFLDDSGIVRMDCSSRRLMMCFF